MASSFDLLLFLLLAWSPLSTLAKLEPSYVRIKSNEPGNRKLVAMMNSDQIVNFLLEPSGTIVDCHVYRRKEILLKLFKFEVKKTLRLHGLILLEK